MSLSVGTVTTAHLGTIASTGGQEEPVENFYEREINNRTSRGIRNLQVEVGAEKIVIKGVTSTYYKKQLAQEALKPFYTATGQRLVNEIQVK